MVELLINCSCGSVFQYNLNLETIATELEKIGVLPIIVPHEDHFVTVYIDRELKIRSVERVILVEDERSSVVVTETLTEEKILKVVNEIEQETSPNKDYFKFASSLLYRIQDPQALFIAGRYVGNKMWKEKRKGILSMGGVYKPALELIVKSELKPILDKTGKTKLSGNTSLEITNCIAPQFIIGLAQGILNALSESASRKIGIKIAYEITGNSVTLSLKT